MLFQINPSLVGIFCSLRHKLNNSNIIKVLKGGEQSPDFRTGGCHKTAPNGRNDLKFCMQGASARLY